MGKLITGKIRASYAHVFKPQKSPNSGQEKYSMCLLIPKSDTKTIKAFEDEFEKVKNDSDAQKVWGGKFKSTFKGGELKDGDEFADEKPEYAGHVFINAYSQSRPGIVDKALNPIIDPEEFYSGCYARVSVSVYPYANQSKGIAIGLNNIQKLEDGEKFGGKATAQADFADFAEEDDDLM